MNGENLRIESFTPNCLLGVTGAVAYKKYKIENLYRLYFHHSYIYEKKLEVKYLPETGGLNVLFTRKLPVSKEIFINRLSDYYNLFHKYYGYFNYTNFIKDIAQLISDDEPLMIEIDFFFMKKHRYYRKVHDQHMMIIYNVDFEQRQFSVCEAVFGYFNMSFDEYFEYFSDVIEHRNRGIFVLTLNRNNSNKESRININYFIDDIDKSLDNLIADNGLKSLNDFCDDLSLFLKSNDNQNNFFVPGMWVFMCDSMNNVNFINQFKKDYPDFNSDALEAVRKSSIITNRKWFYLTLAFNDISKYKTEDLVNAFDKIKDADNKFAFNLKLLKDDLINYKAKNILG